jgi:glycogen debranching enzyme
MPTLTLLEIFAQITLLAKGCPFVGWSSGKAYRSHFLVDNKSEFTPN